MLRLQVFSDTTDIIKTDQKYAEIFKVWNPLENSDDSGFLDVQNMTYKDMIRVANWRKRDDSEKDDTVYRSSYN